MSVLNPQLKCSVGTFFLVLFILSYVGGAIVIIVVPEETFTTYNLVAAFGAALYLMTLPTLLIGISWLFRRKAQPPYVAAFALVGSLTGLASQGMSLQLEEKRRSEAGPSVYSPDTCAFSATFPKVPKLESLNHTSMGSIEQASLVFGESHLRAECIHLKRVWNPDAMEFENHLQAFMKRQGFGDIETRSKITSNWIEAKGRGTKLVDGKWATYEVRILQSERFVFTLMGGGESSSFPQPGIVDFLNSGQKKK